MPKKALRRRSYRLGHASRALAPTEHVAFAPVQNGYKPSPFFGGAAAFALFHLGEMGRGNPTAAGDLRLGESGFLQRFAERLGEEVEQRDELRFLFHGDGSVIVGEWCREVNIEH
jgi:hypothetical protein